MMVRGSVALGLLLASGDAGSAAGLPNSLRHVSCAVVRYYVAKYSVPAAEAWARSRGATDAEIETARQCLKGAPSSPIQAAAEIAAQ
jgi:hypothetical protein